MLRQDWISLFKSKMKNGVGGGGQLCTNSLRFSKIVP